MCLHSLHSSFAIAFSVFVAHAHAAALPHRLLELPHLLIRSARLLKLVHLSAKRALLLELVHLVESALCCLSMSFLMCLL